MRRIAWLVLGLVCLGGFAFAQEAESAPDAESDSTEVVTSEAPLSMWDRLSVEVSTYPEAEGSVVDGELAFRYATDVSGSIRARRTTGTTDSSFPEADYSKRLTDEMVTEIFVLPVVWRASGSPLSLSAGGYVSAQQTTEVGYVRSPGTAGRLNSYDNAVAARFYGPVVGTRLELGGHPLSLGVGVTVVPYFWGTTSQAIRLEPLIPGEGSHDYALSGFPYVAVRVQPTFFGIAAPTIGYEYRRFTAERLVGTADLTGWEVQSATNGVHALTVRGCINLSLTSRTYVRIGYGRRLEWLRTDTGSGPDTFFENIGTFDITVGR